MSDLTIPGQPPDETPLPDTEIVRESDFRVSDMLPQIDASLTEAFDEQHSEVTRLLADVSREIDSSIPDIDREIRALVGQIDMGMDEAFTATHKSIGQLDKQVLDTLNKGEDYLIAQGVLYPQSHYDRVENLTSSNPKVFDENIPPSSSQDVPVVAVGSWNSTQATGLQPGGQCIISGTGEIGTLITDPTRPGYVFCQTPNNTPGPLTGYGDCPPQPSKLGDRCYGRSDGITGVIIRDPNNPQAYLCSVDGRTGEYYPCMVLEPTGGEIPDNPPVGSPPPYPTSPPISPPYPPPQSPPVDPTGWMPVSPPSVPPPPTGSTTIPTGAGITQEIIQTCPTPIIQCPAPILNITVPPIVFPPQTPVPPLLGTPIPPVPPVPVSGTSPPVPGVSPVSPPATPPSVPPAPTVQHLPEGQSSVDWADSNACLHAKELCDKISSAAQVSPGEANTPTPTQDQTWFNGFSETIEFLSNPQKHVEQWWINFGGSNTSTDWGKNFVSALYQVGGTIAKDLMERSLPAGVHNKPYAMLAMSTLGTANFVAKWTGLPIDYYFTSTLYSMRYCDPQYIVGQVDADNMYLRGFIDKNTWECYTKAHGNIPSLWYTSVQAKAIQLNPGEIIQLRNRGFIPTLEAFNERMRKSGIENPAITAELTKLAEFVPPYGDLVSWMVKDVFDDETVKKFGYDKDFDKKFENSETAQAYARANGIDVGVMRNIWRAHWKSLSNTEFLEALHRLRPDRPEVIEWTAQYGSVPPELQGIGLIPEKPLVMTAEDVRYALEINDVAPTFIDAFMSISYHPLTATDGTRAYQIGTLDSEGLYHVYRSVGYNEKDARTVVKARVAEKNKAISTNSGVMSARKIVKYLKDQLITRDEADDRLKDINPDDDTRTRILDGAEREFDIDAMSCTAKGYRLKYLYGEFTTRDAVELLTTAGFALSSAIKLSKKWECERDGRRKEPRVAMLCEWYTSGYITGDQYFERLTRLGYSPEDAVKIGGTCHDKEVYKRAKEAAARAEKHRKEILSEFKTEQSILRKLSEEKRQEYERLTKALDKAKSELDRKWQEEKEIMPVTQPSHNGSP